mmetsp:Transcript_46722/g.92247  ORF Transcript_46722/g.92247 Transcript_46722/m.92247 type:complete len:197 (+) Transcript_46722:1129-1719(+)
MQGMPSPSPILPANKERRGSMRCARTSLEPPEEDRCTQAPTKPEEGPPVTRNNQSVQGRKEDNSSRQRDGACWSWQRCGLPEESRKPITQPTGNVHFPKFVPVALRINQPKLAKEHHQNRSKETTPDSSHSEKDMETANATSALHICFLVQLLFTRKTTATEKKDNGDGSSWLQWLAKAMERAMKKITQTNSLLHG